MSVRRINKEREHVSESDVDSATTTLGGGGPEDNEPEQQWKERSGCAQADFHIALWEIQLIISAETLGIDWYYLNGPSRKVQRAFEKFAFLPPIYSNLYGMTVRCK